ncbi:MAG: glycosyltransferase [Clostridia bacterium]|nr:glycosyltransferase [Clostridia bacterium]
MSATKQIKILYAASTASHLERFHRPYIRALKQTGRVLLMGRGEGVDFSIDFDKRFFSFANFRAVGQIRRILKREAFDKIIVNTSLAAFLIRVALIGMRRRPVVLNIVHGYLFPEQIKGIKDRFLLLCEKLTWKQTDEIAVMNGEDLRIAQGHRLCRGRVDFLYGMGIPDGLGVSGASDGEIRRRLCPEDEILCTFVGELSRRKNQSFLIRAVVGLRREEIPVRLCLIGEGTERAALEQEIRELGAEQFVCLAGSRDDVPALLSATDVYVSASRSEGLPFNVMEAMAMGLPILASDTKGQVDLLSPMPECLYPDEDMDAFCTKLRALCSNKELGMGTRSYPNLEAYRLSAVFEKNLKIMKRGIPDED